MNECVQVSFSFFYCQFWPRLVLKLMFIFQVSTPCKSIRVCLDVALLTMKDSTKMRHKCGKYLFVGSVIDLDR